MGIFHQLETERGSSANLSRHDTQRANNTLVREDVRRPMRTLEELKRTTTQARECVFKSFNCALHKSGL